MPEGLIRAETATDGSTPGPRVGSYLFAGGFPTPFRMASSLQDVLTRVKEGADIVQIVSQYVPLKRAGGRYLGVCPFHNDRHPSMNVNPRLGIYKCFACGAGGDAIKFVQEFEKLGFAEALRLVAAKAGIAVPENFGSRDKGDGDKTAAVSAANQIALQVYVESLEHSPAALAYLKERGLEKDTIRQLQIGAAPEAPDLLLRRAEAKKIPVESLVEAGIVGQGSGGRLFDRFGGRLIFPIFNLSGRVIAFGGRILPGKEGPKYINTPESPLYQKGRVLYGFHGARTPIDQSGEAVIVEGYMDLASLWQAGIRNTVAVCGTALTREHVQLLSRFARKAFLFFDGDAAGRNAVRRSLEALVAQGVEARIPALPADQDPDSLVRGRNADAVAALFAEADDAPAFLARSAGKPVDALSPEEKDALLREAAQLFKAAPSASVREEHLQNLRKRLGLKPAPAASPIFRTAAPAAGAPRARVPGLFLPGASLSLREESVPEWQLARLLLSYPEAARPTAEGLDLEWFSDPRARDLVDHALAMLAETGSLPLRALIERLPEEPREALAALDLAEGEAPSNLGRLLADCAAAVELRHWRREKSGAATLERHMEIQKRIDFLNSRKGGQP